MSENHSAGPRRRGRVVAAAVALLALAIGAVLVWISQDANRSGEGTAAAAPTSAAPTSAAPSSAAPRTTAPTSPSTTASPPFVVTTLPPPAGSTGPSSVSSHPVPAVASASLTGPTAYRGLCPATLDYTATLNVTPATSDVTYHWNDGTASGSLDTVHVVHGTVTLTKSVTLSASGSGSLQFEVISPAPASSNTRNFTVQCIGDTADDASTAPNAYTGDCSPGITFTTNDAITVTNGPAVVSYRWLFSDGAQSSVQTLTFGAGTSTQPVSYTWQRWSSAGTTPEHAWAQLQVLSPVAQNSNRSAFTISCT